jgi:sugar phosphate isomerase/epimerase
MSKPNVGIQLIVYGPRPVEDFAGVVVECAAAGYDGVEIGALFRSVEPAELLDALAANNLLLTGVHTGYGDLIDEKALAEDLAFIQEAGANYLICSGVAPGEGLAGYEAAAETFNRVGARCAEAGLTFCYHNHAWEFAEFDGVKGIHRLTERTDPAVVKLNIDVYWVHIGGEDPAEFIRRYADRAGYYHFKDGSPGVFTELGRGEVDLAAALATAQEVAADWIVYEQDRTDQEPQQSLLDSRAYLRSLGV